MFGSLGVASFSIVFSGKLPHAYTYLKKIDKQSSDRIITILSRIDTKSKLSVYGSSTIETPFLAGLFRPTIYIPAYEYTEEQLYYILLHEYTTL
ncbi:MAG: M56 family metallopeptidase [Blautia sp.]